MIKIHFLKKLITAEGPLSLEVDLEFKEGEFISLYGESGAGKTTTLRILAGLTQPDDGFIQIGNEVWLDRKKRIHVPVQKRRLGYVAQENSLFPNMTLRENLEFALKDKKDRQELDFFLEMMELKNLEHQRPEKLSGGQKQRAALARALAGRPQILLLDEPFSSLDGPMRLKLQEALLGIYQETRITTILVTHDLSEVMKLARKTCVLDQGRIVRFGDPREIFVQGNVSGKFKFAGQIVEIVKDGLLYIVTVQIGNNLTKVAATAEEIAGLQIGEKIIVASKAFNPIILKSTF